MDASTPAPIGGAAQTRVAGVAELRNYEVMLILPPYSDDDVIGRVTDRFQQVISGGGGEVTKVDRWGKRRLAYEIARLTEGFYVIVECTADPSAMKELDRVLTLADEVVRFKAVVRAA